MVPAAQIEKISAGHLKVGDLAPEAVMMVMLQGLPLSYRKGSIPIAMGCLDRHRAEKRGVALTLLELRLYAPSEDICKEAALLQYGRVPRQS